MTKYDYEELKAKAFSSSAVQQDLKNLGEWMERFADPADWDGDSWRIEGYRLYPFEQEISPDEWEVVGYELK